MPLAEDGSLDIAQLPVLLDERTRLLAVTQISNVLGALNPVKAMIAQAKAVGAVVLVDGAQSIMHQPVDVQDLNCDFFVFSGHKIYGLRALACYTANVTCFRPCRRGKAAGR